jgi:hypothetical protein
MTTESDQRKSLPQLALEAQRLTALLLESGGEVSPELEQALALIETQLPKKVDAYAVIMERMEDEATYWHRKAAEMLQVAKRIEKAHERMKERITFAMSQAEEEALQGETYRFKLSPGPDRVVVTDPSLIPTQYIREKVELSPDKDKIKADIKLGKDVPGATLERSPVLRKSLKGR